MVLAGRRDFLRDGLMAVGSLALLSPGAISLESLVGRVSFDDALGDKSLRQQYLEQVMRGMFGNAPEYRRIGGLYYDPDRSLANKKYHDMFVAASQRPESLDYVTQSIRLSKSRDEAIKFMMKHKAFPNLKGDSRKQAIDKFLDSREGIRDYAERIVLDYLKNVTDGMQYSVAQTILDGNTGELGVYSHAGMFDGLEMPSWKITVPSSQELFETVLAHEFNHVCVVTEGIEFNGETIRVAGKGVGLPDDIVNFIVEGRGYVAGLEYSRKFNASKPAVMEYHPAYLVAAGIMRENWFSNQVPIYGSYDPAQRSLLNAIPDKTEALLRSEFGRQVKYYDEISNANAYALGHKDLLKKKWP